MNNVLISIIVPVYNVEKYIRRCVNSILNQTYKCLDIILVNDGSDDNSGSICDEFALLDQRISVIHKMNGGLSSARNAGIKSSRGEYIFFLDSDDELPLNSINTLFQLILKYPTVDIVQGNFSSEPNSWFTLWPLKDLTYNEYLIKDKWLSFRILNRDVFPVMSCNKLIKRSFIINHNLFFKIGIIHEDEHWNFFMIKYLKSMAYTKEFTYIYHKNNDGLTLGLNSKKRSQSSYLIIIKDWIDNITRENRDIQLNSIFAVSKLQFSLSNYREENFIKSLYVLFPLGFGKSIINYFLSKKQLTIRDIKIIYAILSIELNIAKWF